MNLSNWAFSSASASPSVINIMKVLQQRTCFGCPVAIQAGFVPKKYGSRPQAPEMYPSVVGQVSAGDVESNWLGSEADDGAVIGPMDPAVALPDGNAGPQLENAQG